MRKTFFSLGMVFLLVAGGEQGYRWWKTPSPPPPEPSKNCQILLDSLEDPRAWERGLICESIILHPSAKIAVFPGGSCFGTTMYVKMWDGWQPTRLSAAHELKDIPGFDKNDLAHIRRAYHSAVRRIDEMNVEARMEKLKRK